MLFRSFALRATLGRQLAAGDDTPAPPAAGRELTADRADAALVAAAVAAGRPLAGLWGLFAGRPPGPAVRAVAVDDARFGFLRFGRTEPPPAPAWGRPERWSTAQLGDEPAATVRCVVEVPGGVALGSDYGLTLWRRGRFEPFPWPAGARREARRVEAMAMHQGALWIATSQCLVSWDFRGEPTLRKHGADDEQGWDELRCLLSTPGGLLRGLRTGLVGVEGAPPLREVFALAATPGGVVYAGTGSGQLHVVGGGAPIATLGGPHRPVRHLAFADGLLHVAAGDQHHVFDGCTWSRSAPEPTAFAVDARGRLWLVAEGGVYAWTRGGPVRLDLAVERPWALAATADRLWIGGREAVWSVPIR